MEIEHVEMTKLLGVTLDCKLSWSKHIVAVVAKAMLCLLNNLLRDRVPLAKLESAQFK